jgi:hypothetical protein
MTSRAAWRLSSGFGGGILSLVLCRCHSGGGGEEVEVEAC